MPYTAEHAGQLALMQSDHLLFEAVRGLEQSLVWMPKGACHDDWKWALTAAHAEQQKQWRQISGLSTIVRLYESMFARLLSQDELSRLAPFAAIIIVQQTYEIISDNLAIGLADPANDDVSLAARRRVLAVYNQVMVDKLSGVAEPVVELMAPARAAAGELEYDLWPALVASCEATLALDDCLSGTPVGALVSAGLTQRYAGVSTLIAGGPFDLAKRLTLGADTILVRPTLAFVAGVIAEKIRPMRGWSTVIADRSLGAALSDSAVLVRLLNDVGTELLTAPEQTLAHPLATLRAAALRHQEATLRELFGRCIDELGSAFNRIKKDVVQREFNVALDDRTASRHTNASVAQFITNLGELRNIYADRSDSLHRRLALLSERLGDSLVSDIINEFVQFHAQLYSHHFDDVRGEFAV